MSPRCTAATPCTHGDDAPPSPSGSLIFATQAQSAPPGPLAGLRKGGTTQQRSYGGRTGSARTTRHQHRAALDRCAASGMSTYRGGQGQAKLRTLTQLAVLGDLGLHLCRRRRGGRRCRHLSLHVDPGIMRSGGQSGRHPNNHIHQQCSRATGVQLPGQRRPARGARNAHAHTTAYRVGNGNQCPCVRTSLHCRT